MPVLLPYLLLCHLTAGCLAAMPVTMHERGSHVTTRSVAPRAGPHVSMTCTPTRCPYTWPGWQDMSGWSGPAGGHGPGHGVVAAGHLGSGTGGHSF